jgi:transposase
MKILSEIGPDLSRFANVKHFCSVGTVSGHQDQRRQGHVGEHEALGQPRSPSPEDGSDEPVSKSIGPRCLLPAAVYAHYKPRANTAVAHKLARLVYSMRTRGEFVDQGQQHYEEQQRQRSIAALKRRAAALGWTTTVAA